MNETDNRVHLYALSRVKGIGPVRLRMVQAYFGSYTDAWRADPGELQSAGLEPKLILAISDARKVRQPETEIENYAKQGIKLLCWLDADYPRLLNQIDDPPPVLYVKGTFTHADEWAVGIVGTRNATVYGRQAAEMLASDLASNHVTVVSGLARGIDACAHRAALKAGGRTVAVLGCGVDVAYPAENARLAEEITEHGALVSDYPPGTQPEALNFPPRNRIISGLCLGVVVVEADERSGALITSNFAVEQGRDVFAVPGNVFNRTSRGTNKLIQKGAKLVLNAADILDELNLTMVISNIEAQEVAPENEIERQLIAQLSHEPVLTDDLVNSMQMPVEVVTSTLALMELKGMVRQATGTSYVLAREEHAVYGRSNE